MAGILLDVMIKCNLIAFDSRIRAYNSNMQKITGHTRQLHQLGLKATHLRETLLRCLLESKLPLDVASCMQYLTKHQISFDRVTVYRNLETFVKKGIAKKIDLQDGRYYFEKADDCSHLICDHCGKIEHVHIEKSHEIAHEIVEHTGFHITQHVSDFFGTCRACQKQ